MVPSRCRRPERCRPDTRQALGLRVCRKPLRARKSCRRAQAAIVDTLRASMAGAAQDRRTPASLHSPGAGLARHRRVLQRRTMVRTRDPRTAPDPLVDHRCAHLDDRRLRHRPNNQPPAPTRVTVAPQPGLPGRDAKPVQGSPTPSIRPPARTRDHRRGHRRGLESPAASQPGSARRRPRTAAVGGTLARHRKARCARHGLEQAGGPQRRRMADHPPAPRGKRALPRTTVGLARRLAIRRQSTPLQV